MVGSCDKLINNAFLQGILKDEMYIAQPLDIINFLARIMVCKLEKDCMV